ncbi:hypothetical protein PIB30_090649, partial [Stylosanthes scabra]|nr:hypothetical protein [Stylosanthes scabra]
GGGLVLPAALFEQAPSIGVAETTSNLLEGTLDFTACTNTKGDQALIFDDIPVRILPVLSLKTPAVAPLAVSLLKAASTFTFIQSLGGGLQDMIHDDDDPRVCYIKAR